MFVAAFLAFNYAYAGFFIFGDDLLKFNEAGTADIVQISNSQTIPLLEGGASFDATAAKGGGDITIINNNSLLAESGPMGTMADIEDLKANQGQISVYVVRGGDTLSEIAKMFGVSVNTIIWSNDIAKGDSIRVGQTLVILPVTGIKYEVKTGDTIGSIAKKLNGEIEDIIRYNDLDTNEKLIVGQIVIVPNGELPAQQSQLPKSSSLPSKNPMRGGSGPHYAGYYIRPIVGGIKTQGLHGYNGVDLANSCGAPVLAAASGDVIISKSSGWNGGYGNYVVISHPNGTQTLYSHLKKTIVSPGWHVVQGQVIGYEGTTGKSTGCHVHFEIRGAKNPF